MRTKDELTQTMLKEHLSYNPCTGIFVRKSGKRKNKISGSPNTKGYMQVHLLGFNYYAHRLAFLWMVGKWPAGDVDHIDQNKSNNKWVNLREVTRSINMHNVGPICNNTSGIRGVDWHKASGKWRSRIRVNGKECYAGLFDSFKEAATARKILEQKFIHHTPDNTEEKR